MFTQCLKYAAYNTALECKCSPLPVCVQTLGENAPSQLILYHYPDLKAEKGVVLMMAEMDPKFIVSTFVWTSQVLCLFPIIYG